MKPSDLSSKCRVNLKDKISFSQEESSSQKQWGMEIHNSNIGIRDQRQAKDPGISGRGTKERNSHLTCEMKHDTAQTHLTKCVSLS